MQDSNIEDKFPDFEEGTESEEFEDDDELAELEEPEELAEGEDYLKVRMSPLTEGIDILEVEGRKYVALEIYSPEETHEGRGWGAPDLTDPEMRCVGGAMRTSSGRLLVEFESESKEVADSAYDIRCRVDGDWGIRIGPIVGPGETSRAEHLG